MSLAVLSMTILAYSLYGTYAAFNGRTWTDEVTYLAKSLWYLNGVSTPYSVDDATWYMPLYFYVLGSVQFLFGQGYVAGRMFSVVIGGLSGIIVYFICRRFVLSATVSALAVAVYLLTTTTAYYFATATPLATVAFLHLLTILHLMRSLEKPSLLNAAILGILFCFLFFFRQNMILAIGILGPAYLLALKRQRALHAGVLISAVLLGAAAFFFAFPDRLLHYAIRLPLLTEILANIGLLPNNLDIIQSATETPLSLGLSLSAFRWQDPLYAFFLPFSGTILAVALCMVFSPWPKPLRLGVGGYFFALAALHYVGSANYCPSCILTYTNYFISIGAIATGGLVAALWQHHSAPKVLASSASAVLVAIILSMNAFLSLLSDTSNRYRFYPQPMFFNARELTEMVEAELFASVIANHTTSDKPVLVINNQPALTYAVFHAGRIMPPQSLNPRQSYRAIRSGISESDRLEVVAALEAESLWTDDSLVRWIYQDFSTVIYVEDFDGPRPTLEAALDRKFNIQSRVNWRGWYVRFYQRPATDLDADLSHIIDPAVRRRMACELTFVHAGFARPCQPD